MMKSPSQCRPHEITVTVPASVTLADVPQSTRQGDRLILALPGAGWVAIAPRMMARHVRSLQGGRDQLALNLSPGSTTLLRRVGQRLVVDVYAPGMVPPGQAQGGAVVPASVNLGGLASAPATKIAAGAGGTRPALSAASVPARARQAEPPAPPLDVGGAPVDAVAPPAAASPEQVDGAEALRAVRVAGPGDTILLPFDSKVGAAAFGAGGVGHVVFDEHKAIDLAALKDDPVFASARITLSPGSTHLSMSVPAGKRLSLRRQEQGWAVSVQGQQPDRQPAAVRLRAEKLIIAMKQAADVVVLIDATTGAKMLVGTVHEHGDAIIVPHVSAEFRLLPSWEGVAVSVISDRLALEAVRDGFALSSASGAPLVTIMADSTQAALETVGSLTHRFAIPPLSMAALRHRLDADISAAGHAPRQARFRPRLAAAQDMLGLGMDREAASLLAVARNDDPAQEARPDAAALLAIATWLAAREDEPPPALDAIDNSALGASDEVALWRALLPPRGAAAPAAARAAVVAADWRLLAAYPSPLRRRLMPRAAAILIAGHQLEAAEALLGAGADMPMDGLRAQLLAAQGRATDALAVLDRVTSGEDRKQAAAALRDAVEMQLRAGAIKPTEAAHRLEKQLYVWRDPGFEIARRLRVAALLTQAGDFRAALAGLREADQLFPQAHGQIRDAEDQTIRALLRGGAGAGLAPLDLLALVADNADLLGQGNVAASLTPVLVDKLTALDLPERADRLVGKLIDGTAEPLPRAMLGLRMAALRLDQDDAAGALAALDQTMAEGLPADLDTRRAVMRARALARLGEDGPALSLLAAHDGAEAWEMSAQLHEKAHDWRGATAALQKLVQASVPATGALSDAQQDMVLRLASAASQAGDGAALRALSAGPARRLSPGPRASLFAALTVQPVREVGDLPRSQLEADAARALPAAWAGYTVH